MRIALLLALCFPLLFSGCSCNREKKGPVTGTHRPLSARQNDRTISAAKQTSSPQPSPEKKKRKKKHHLTITEGKPVLKRDSLFIEKMQYLRSNALDIDINEPVSREFLGSSLPVEEFHSVITIGPEIYFKASFDNDIFDNTDRFYTNGIRLDLIHPVFQRSPIRYVQIPYWRAGINYYGIALVQNMYTPFTTKVGGIHSGDRPYAAYLYFAGYKITNDAANRYRQASEIDMGVIGPSSMGDHVQSIVHTTVPTNNEPLGWEYQVQDDLVLNYRFSLEKGLFPQKKNTEINVFANAALGTLYTNISGGFYFRAGVFNPYFINLGLQKKRMNRALNLKNFQWFFFINTGMKVVGYDATLQGGMFNHSSPYTLSADQISRVIFQGSGGVVLTYGAVRLECEQFLLSPEFAHGWWHKWIHLGLTFCL